MPWYWIALALVFGGFGLTGCGGEKDQIKEYPVSVPAAVRLLENADNASFRYFRQCGVLFDLSNYRSDDHTVTWTARAGGDEVLSFAVAIVESPKGVTLKLSVQPDQNGREMYDGTQQYNHPLVKQPLRPAVAELIDSAMEKRPFDQERIAEKDRYLDRSPSGSACSIDRQILERGFPARYDDPPGISVENAQKLATKNNWPKN